MGILADRLPPPWTGLVVVSWLWILAAPGLWADDAAGIAFFESRIRPVLVEHCQECHAADSKPVKGGLRLDSRAGILAGGDSGPAIDLDDPAGSLLVQALRHDGFEMPPLGKLPDHVADDFVTWIRAGAADPRPVPSGGPAAAAGRWSFPRPGGIATG